MVLGSEFRFEWGRRPSWDGFIELDDTIGEGFYGDNRINKEGSFFDETIAGLPEIDTQFLDAAIEGVSVSDCHVCITYSYTMAYQRYSTTTCYIKPECRPRRPEPPPRWDTSTKLDVPEIPSWNFPNGGETGYTLEILPGINRQASQDQSGNFPPTNNEFRRSGRSILVDVGAREQPVVELFRTGLVPTLTQIYTAELGLSDNWSLTLFIQSPNGNRRIAFRVPGNSRFDGLIAWGGLTIYRLGNVQTGEIFESLHATSATYLETRIVNAPPEPRPPQPPDNNNPDPEKQMNCCPEVLARLRQLQDDMTILMRWTGARPGVMNVPKTLMKKEGLTSSFLGGLLNLFDNGEMSVRSLPEFFKWQIERQMEFQGEWPVRVETSEGESVGLPNMAVAAQSIFQKNISEGELNQIINAAIAKTLLEVGLTRQNSALINSQLETIIAYLNIPVAEVLQQMRHGFTMPPTVREESSAIDNETVDTLAEFRDFLEESEQAIKVYQYNDTDAPDMGDLQYKVSKIFDILSVNRISSTSSREEIFAQLRREATSAEPNIAEWLDEVEKQFGEEFPWGNNFDERPRLELDS